MPILSHDALRGAGGASNKPFPRSDRVQIAKNDGAPFYYWSSSSGGPQGLFLHCKLTRHHGHHGVSCILRSTRHNLFVTCHDDVTTHRKHEML